MRTLFLAAAALLALSACNRGKPSDRLDDNLVAATNVTSKSAANSPAKRCASGRTYDLLKHELFRRAAQLRGKDDAIFDRLAAGASLRVERPVVKSQDEGLGSIACSASFALDLPPGLAVAGGRSTLVADIEYTLQPAADGDGDVVTLTNADAITVPLATLGRGGSALPSAPTAPPMSPPAPTPMPTMPRPPATPVPPTPPPPSASTASNPSFACARARTRSEIAICQDPGLAQSDRRMSVQYREAYAAASPRQRAILLSSARRFYGFRDNCPDARCIANGYRGRMREIDDIMRSEGGDQPDDQL